MILRVAFAVALVCCLVQTDSFAQSSSQRAKWLKHLKLMTGEDPKGDILVETESSEISAALKNGDPALAQAVMLASERMLDNEAMFELVAYAVLYNQDAALKGLRALPPRGRNNVLDVLPDGAELIFADSAKKQAKYNEIVRKLNQQLKEPAAKASAPESGDGMPAVINDPDGYTNVRARADKSSKIVTTIKKDERFMVLDEKGDWCRVETADGDEGYVHKSRVRFLK